MMAVARIGLLVVLVVSGCGRIAFDPLPVAQASDAPADSPWFSSCAGLAPTCGPAGTSSCCDSLPVPGGTFYRGYDVGADSAYTDTTNPATISSFRLDTYEVTVGRFRQFVNAGLGTRQNPPEPGAGAHPQIQNSGWDSAWTASLAADTAELIAGFNCSSDTRWTWTDMPGANESLPISCVNWAEAMAFCAWDGGYLPTEAELNYAAVGGDEQRAYPWSSPPSSLTIDCSYANYMDGTYCVSPPDGALNRVGSESPRGDGRWGQADLAGNVWEWTLDWLVTPYSNPCNDCAELTAGSGRVFRGGIFNYFSVWLRGGYRGLNSGPTGTDFNIGFRCARNSNQ